MGKHRITNPALPDERANDRSKRETGRKASPARLLLVELLAMF
jgi:hypothetical protein